MSNTENNKADDGGPDIAEMGAMPAELSDRLEKAKKLRQMVTFLLEEVPESQFSADELEELQGMKREADAWVASAEALQTSGTLIRSLFINHPR